MEMPPLPPPPMPPKRIDWYAVYNISGTIFTLFIVVAASFGMFKIVQYGDNCEKVINYGASSKLYGTVRDTEVIYNTRLAGLYSPKSNIFCMYGENFTEEQDTVCHEYCHWLIDKEQCYEVEKGDITCAEHFCEDKKW